MARPRPATLRRRRRVNLAIPAFFSTSSIARAAGESARVTVGVELKFTGVAHAGQNAAPSGKSRAQEEHFIRKFRSRLESRHRTLRLTPIQRIWGCS